MRLIQGLARGLSGQAQAMIVREQQGICATVLPPSIVG